MNVYQAIITFVITWWLFFFMALPFGADPEEAPQKGNVESAPAKPRLLIKALAATLLAALATWGVAEIIDSGWITFRPPAPAR